MTTCPTCGDDLARCEGAHPLSYRRTDEYGTAVPAGRQGVSTDVIEPPRCDRVLLDELRRIRDEAFPSDTVTYQYALEHLLDLVELRIRELEESS